MTSKEFRKGQPSAENRNRYGGLGRQFERELENVHSIYAARKIGKINRNPKEWVYISQSEYKRIESKKLFAIIAKTTSGRCLKSKKSLVDFSGHIGGRYIEFDAKETKQKSLSFRNISQHQIWQILETEGTGAVAGLMIHFSSLNRVFFVPASVVDKAHSEMAFKRGRKSISLDLCEKQGVEIPKKQGFFDWVEVVF